MKHVHRHQTLAFECKLTTLMLKVVNANVLQELLNGYFAFLDMKLYSIFASSIVH